MEAIERPASRIIAKIISCDGTELRQSQEMIFAMILAASQRKGLIEVHDRGGCQRVQSGAEVRHGGREDSGDDEAGDSGWQIVPDEIGINPVGWTGWLELPFFVIDVKNSANHHKQCELEENHEPTRK